MLKKQSAFFITQVLPSKVILGEDGMRGCLGSTCSSLWLNSLLSGRVLEVGPLQAGSDPSLLPSPSSPTHSLAPWGLVYITHHSCWELLAPRHLYLFHSLVPTVPSASPVSRCPLPPILCLVTPSPACKTPPGYHRKQCLLAFRCVFVLLSFPPPQLVHPHLTALHLLFCFPFMP